MSNIQRIAKAAFAKYAAVHKQAGPDLNADAGVGTYMNAIYPGREFIGGEHALKGDSVPLPENKEALNAELNGYMRWLANAHSGAVSAKIPNYATQRAFNVAEYLYRNPDKAKLLQGDTLQSTYTNFTNDVATPYLNAATAAGFGLAAGAKAAPMVFDEKGKPTDESVAANKDVLNRLGQIYEFPVEDEKGNKKLPAPLTDKPMTLGQLLEQRKSQANVFAQQMNAKPGTPEYDEWFNYFMNRGNENYRKFRKLDIPWYDRALLINPLLSDPGSKYKMPAVKNDTERAKAEVYGRLMANRARHGQYSAGIPS